MAGAQESRPVPIVPQVDQLPEVRRLCARLPVPSTAKTSALPSPRIQAKGSEAETSPRLVKLVGQLPEATE